VAHLECDDSQDGCGCKTKGEGCAAMPPLPPRLLPPGLEAAKAKVAQHPGRDVGGCQASTRSPSREDGGGDTTEGFSSPEILGPESPLGHTNQRPPPWQGLSGTDLEEDKDEDEDDEEEDSRSSPQRTPRRGKGVGATMPEGRSRKGRAAADTTSVVLRGLPFNVTEDEVLTFIRKAGVSREDLAPDAVVALLANAQGRPSGFAEVRLARGVDFWDVRERLHMQHLRGRYIEALPPRPARKSAAKHGGRQGGRKG